MRPTFKTSTLPPPPPPPPPRPPPPVRTCTNRYISAVVNDPWNSNSDSFLTGSGTIGHVLLRLVIGQWTGIIITSTFLSILGRQFPTGRMSPSACPLRGGMWLRRCRWHAAVPRGRRWPTGRRRSDSTPPRGGQRKLGWAQGNTGIITFPRRIDSVVGADSSRTRLGFQRGDSKLELGDFSLATWFDYFVNGTDRDCAVVLNIDCGSAPAPRPS